MSILFLIRLLFSVLVQICKKKWTTVSLSKKRKSKNKNLQLYTHTHTHTQSHSTALQVSFFVVNASFSSLHYPPHRFTCSTVGLASVHFSSCRTNTFFFCFLTALKWQQRCFSKLGHLFWVLPCIKIEDLLYTLFCWNKQSINRHVQCFLIVRICFFSLF